MGRFEHDPGKRKSTRINKGRGVGRGVETWPERLQEPGLEGQDEHLVCGWLCTVLL